MSKDIDLSQYSIRTDLAVEAATDKKISGVTSDVENIRGVKVTTTKVDQDGANEISKKQGEYITLEFQGLRDLDEEEEEVVREVFTEQLKKMMDSLGIQENHSCLVVGLGNWSVTPDAVGPEVIKDIIVTRHLFELQPESVSEGYRPVCAISPGVMGTTGLETSDVIKGVQEKAEPDFIIVVDALASRSIERVNTTIQITDTGIHPGSGVGNKRKDLSQETLGIPVIAIGVPTVIDAVTVTSDTIDFMLKHLGKSLNNRNAPSNALKLPGVSFGDNHSLNEEDLPDEKSRETFLGLIGNLDEDEKRELIHDVLSPLGHNLMVTPKEVDVFVGDVSKMVAIGINSALHDLGN